MLQSLLTVSASIDRINDWVGRQISWFSFLLVLVICIDVLMRYFFNQSVIWITELEKYLFAFIFLFGAAYAFKEDKHVRVDLFYSKMGPKGKAWINLLGGVLFLIPWSFIIVQVAWHYAYASWNIGESSAQPGGLPALYLMKFGIFLGFALLLLQAISSVFRSLHVILSASKANA